MVYLDYASHTPANDDVLQTYLLTEQNFTGNPMSNHTIGEKARDELSRVTFSIAQILDIEPEEIIFTSSATEANNLAIKGIAQTYKYKGRHVLSTCLEHPSVSGTLTALQETDFEVELLRIMPDGIIDLAHLKSAIRTDTILVCVSTIDSELGVIQPIQEISNIIAKHPNCLLHIDASQAMGKMPATMAKAATMSFSPHKFYGLCGSGVLLKQKNIVLEPQIHGGGSASIYRSGTPCLGLAAACEKALNVAFANQTDWFKKVTILNSYLRQRLDKYPFVRINSPKNGSPYILNLSIKDIIATQFVTLLDKQGVCVSVKSACSTNHSPSRPVLAVTGDRKNALCSWRVSLSHLTEIKDLDIFLSALLHVFENLCLEDTK